MPDEEIEYQNTFSSWNKIGAFLGTTAYKQNNFATSKQFSLIGIIFSQNL